LRPVINLGLDLAAGLAVCTVKLRRRHAVGQFAPEGVEIPALSNEGLLSIARRKRVGCLRVRNIHHGAGFDQVDVATYECVGISPEQGHQHLVQRHAGRLVLGGNPAGIVARLDHDLAGAGNALDRRCSDGLRHGAGGRPGVRNWRVLPCRQGGCGHRFAGQHGCRRHQGRAAASQVGRVKQHRVVAGDTTRGPPCLKNQIHKGLADGPVAAQAQIRPAVRASLEPDLQTRGGGGVFKSSRPENVSSCHADPEAGGFIGAEIGNVDFRAQGFTQGGLDRDAA